MEEKVFKIIAKVLNVDIKSISEESSPDDFENWDSLNHMKIVLALEQEFGVSFTDKQIIELLNVKLILLTLKELM